MSRWQHNICADCWEKQNPGQMAVGFVQPQEETCCFCGAANRDGIYLRREPYGLACHGQCDN